MLPPPQGSLVRSCVGRQLSVACRACLRPRTPNLKGASHRLRRRPPAALDLGDPYGTSGAGDTGRQRLPVPNGPAGARHRGRGRANRAVTPSCRRAGCERDVRGCVGAGRVVAGDLPLTGPRRSGSSTPSGVTTGQETPRFMGSSSLMSTRTQASKGCTPAPAHQVPHSGSGPFMPRRGVVRQLPPRASRAIHVEDRLNDPPAWVDRRAAAAAHWHHRLDHRPLLIGQIRGIAGRGRRLHTSP
jgi:hypothetical protein